jgi:hypothetical protein
MVDGEAGHFGITVDIGEVAQLHAVQSFFASALAS